MYTPLQLDVVVIGNAGIDTNIYLYGQEIDFSVEANFTQNLDCVGQAGGYAARGYAALGKCTAFIGAVGRDFQGDHIRTVFNQDGIDTSLLFDDPQGTARSVNIVYPDGHRKNFYDGRGHMLLEPDLPACRELLAATRLAHFNIPNWARRLLPAARQAGALIACDIQDVVDPGDAYRQDFIAWADFLFFSAANFADPTLLIQHFHRLNPQAVIIAGMGAQGAALGVNGQVQRFPAPELTTPILDTNGAGDSLAVGFLSSYILDGCTLEDSLLRGQIAARHCCTLRGVSDGLITSPQLDASFHSLKARI
jgi:sugar/nucleoside kinase (ribokinase family)